MVAGMLVGGAVNETPPPAEPPMVVGTWPAAWLGMVAGIVVGGVVVTMSLLEEAPVVVGRLPEALLEVIPVDWSGLRE
jgi:hypothetical protein